MAAKAVHLQEHEVDLLEILLDDIGAEIENLKIDWPNMSNKQRESIKRIESVRKQVERLLGIEVVRGK